MLENVGLDHLPELIIQGVPLIDVRAPIEFSQGALPGAVNLPILNDEERALIGTIYKQQGSEEALQRGFQIVSGAIKEERVQAWRSYILANPNVVLYCFRGGKRSQITQQWLREVGLSRPLIMGGYKRARQYLLESLSEISNKQSFLVLSGPTGSGKTQLIQRIGKEYPTIDLEFLAQHRGSAFGAKGVLQPSQINFENQLATALLKYKNSEDNRGLLLEDESRLIGRVHLPEDFFAALRRSPVVWLEEPLSQRVNNIFQDYVLETLIGQTATLDSSERRQALPVFVKYQNSVQAISRKLGGQRAQEILADIQLAQESFFASGDLEPNKKWIEKLLQYYYDPLYLGSLSRRQVEVTFRGSLAEAELFLRSQTK